MEAPPFTRDSATFAMLEYVETEEVPVLGLLNVELDTMDICCCCCCCLSSVFDIAFITNKMNRAEVIDRAIDKTHLRSTKKIIPHVKSIVRGATDKEIEQENKTRPKDQYPHSKKNYYYPVFSSHQHGFQMDLLEQSSNRDKAKYPHYFLMFVNVNTKKAYAIPCESKRKDEINKLIKDFVKEVKVSTIQCDDEAAFSSDVVLKTLNENSIGLKVITEQRHTALSIIDRLIRTLRDMNLPTVKSKRQSDDPKYRDFSIKRMNKLIDIYNNTVHNATGLTPNEMEANPRLEVRFIIKKIYERERRRKITDFELKEGVFVRYIIPNDKHAKKRYRVSAEAYKISHKEGNAYVLLAQDGSTRTLSRWRLFPVGETLPKKMKWSNTFNRNTGTVEEILSYDANKNKYTVRFSMPDGSTYIDKIPASYLRGAHPQKPSAIEEEFFKRV